MTHQSMFTMISHHVCPIIYTLPMEIVLFPGQTTPLVNWLQTTLTGIMLRYDWLIFNSSDLTAMTKTNQSQQQDFFFMCA